jgi:transketolase
VPNTTDDEKRINAIRALSIDTVQKANSGHPGLPLGASAMAYTLWTRHLNHDPADPKWFNRDRFVLSAGHGSALLYTLLYLTGYDLTLDDLKSFRQMGSRTPGHPEYHHTAGVEVTTGPLGQGFANAVGLAIAEAQLAGTYNRDQTIIDHYTYVLCGDGDLMEGISYEAASIAGHLKLGKLIAMYDDNNVSLAGPTSLTFTEDMVKRFESCGWHVQFVDRAHGNDVATIDSAIMAAKDITDRPSIICVRTEIGFASPLADSFKSHGEPLGAENVKKTKEKLNWPTEPDFFVPDEILSWWRENGKRVKTPHDAWNSTFATWKKANPELAAQFERAVAGKPPTNVEWPKFTEENGSIASRDAGGIVMNAIAKAMPELIGGSADLDPSTKTYLKEQGDFTPENRAGRNVHYGVREHAMAAASNGIALHGGLFPFCATFFNFVDYCKPAVRLAAINQIREVFVFTHDSVFLGEDGPTHQPIEQLAQLRATPNVVTIRPADSLETLEAWKNAIQPETGPTVMVLSRQKLPFLGERKFDIKRGAYILRDTEGTPDLIFIATGSEVSLALAAADMLKAKGTKARVVSAPAIELFAKQDEAYRESILPSAVKARVSIEAGATLGWHRWVGDHGIAIGIDHFGTSAPAAAIAKEYGFTPEAIAQKAASLLARA